MSARLYLGCTYARHQRLGVNAVVNARAGLQHLNDLTIEEIEMQRDACKIRDWQTARVRIHQFNSRCFRRHSARLAHLISSHQD